MAIRTGKVIMAKNIRLDKGYKNVLSYSESQMVTLVSNNAVQSFTNCSFIRPGENAIKLEMSYNNALRCNYLAFQNPDYSNKWFFAFIDNIDYVSNSTVIVRYTIDEFSTWFDYWQPEACFVEREHANTDNPGDNLVPEQLELGDYVNNGVKTSVGFGNAEPASVSNLYYVVISNYSPKNVTYLATDVCGIPVAGGLYFFSSWQAMTNTIDHYSDIGKLDSITQVYAIPSNLGASMMDDSTAEHWGSGLDEDSYYRYNGTRTAYSMTYSLAAPTNNNGYTPVNKKLLTSPYICCLLANTAGSSNPLAYEYFGNRTVTVITYGTPSIGCSIITYPTNYKGQEINYLEGIPCGKFPTLSWSGDAFTNWLTQNSVNIGLGLAGDLLKVAIGAGATVAGAGLAGAGVAVGGVAGVESQLREIYQHSIVPVTSRGTVNCGDILTSKSLNGCYLLPLSIKAAQAERLDKYFTRFGYKTNLVKVPNQTGRQNWNFVKIGSGEDIGVSTTNDYFSVPASSMEMINNIYRAGVTIWHNHANVGDFSLSNPIVS